MRRMVFALCLGALPLLAAAQNPPEPTLVEPPPTPAPIQTGEALEPEVTIIPGERETIQEYRVNGMLYMIKVVPSRGPAYFLVDTDGDGNLETRRNNLDPGLLIPRWILLRWD